MHPLRARALALAALGVLALGARARAADLIVMHAPPDAGDAVTAARAALAQVAVVAGAAFLDLSPSPPPAPAAPALISRGIERFQALQLDEAQAALDDALAEARHTGAAGLGASELSDLFIHRALIDTQRGDAAAGWDELVHAATVDPARLLDPARFPPKVAQSFQRAKEAVRGAGRGRLEVNAPGCRVAIDGRPAIAPAELAYGDHFVQVACPGERPAGGVVLLDQPRETVDLPRAPIEAPADASLVALARERGARRLLAVTLSASAAAPPSARLRLLDGQSGALLEDAEASPENVGSASERLLGERPAVALGAKPAPARTSWYQKPWLWAAAGVAITAAVLLPFAIDRGDPSGFTGRPADADVWK